MVLRALEGASKFKLPTILPLFSKSGGRLRREGGRKESAKVRAFHWLLLVEIYIRIYNIIYIHWSAQVSK